MRGGEEGEEGEVRGEGQKGEKKYVWDMMVVYGLGSI